MRGGGKTTTEERPVGRKRMLATGRKIDGTWEVRTFLRAAAGSGRRTFWESHDPRKRRK